MNRKDRSRAPAPPAGGSPLPFTRRNGRMFGAGLAAIVLGYLFLSIGPADSFWSLSLAPILLVAGYCVLIPIALLMKGRAGRKDESKGGG